MKNIIIIPPDGNGSKGDEAMVRGAIELYYGSGNIKLLTPREALWKECILDLSAFFEEEYYPLEELKNYEYDSESKLVIIGADLMDGLFFGETIECRLDAAQAAVDKESDVEIISCSFRDNVNEEIITRIKKQEDKVRWYLRDYLSMQNFNVQTGMKGYYFPDLAFQYQKCESKKTRNYCEIIDEHKKLNEHIVAINMCEHSFRGFYNENSDSTREEYIQDFMKEIVNCFPNTFFVLISNDTREWENHWGDARYLECVAQYLELNGLTNKFIVIDSFCSEAEILVILEKIEVLVSGRMHLTIAAMRSGCIPIAYYGNSGSFRDIQKFKGMFLNCIGRNDFVVSDVTSLRGVAALIMEDYDFIHESCQKYYKTFDQKTDQLIQNKKQVLGSIQIPKMTSNLDQVMYGATVRFAEKNNEINRLRQVNNDQYWDILDKENIIKEKVTLIEEKQNIIEEQNDKLYSLNTEFEDHMRRLNGQIRKQEEEFCEKTTCYEKQIEEFRDREKELEEQIIALKQEVLNKEGHIQLLLPPEREYKKIVNSKMFKIMRAVCGTYDFFMIIPRFIGRNLFAFCKMLTHVNIPKLKIAFGYCKNEGLVGAYHHLMRDYHQGDLKKIEIITEEKVHEEITRLDQCNPLNIPEFENPMVSIVIPVYNQFTYTYYCIKSIIENSGDIAYEIILADDYSNDLTTEIKSIINNIKVERTPENLRFLRNCNNAAKAAKGKYILFLNNDTEVQKNWLQPLVDLIENDSTIGMVGSKLVYSDGSLQEAGGIVWRDGSAWNYGRNMDAMMPEYNYVKEVDYISGASIMIRSDLWTQIGGFDELFAPAYCEDSDLAFEVRKAGYKVVYQPLSVVVHYEGKSNGTDLNSGVKKYQVENNIKLQKKWKEEFKKHNENAQNVFKARERSMDKKVILVIDHYVPQFDKDAGSKTTFQYLKMFVKQGYSVKFIGDNFYQHEPYTTVLQQMGVEVLYGPWYAQHWKEWILENQRNIDFVYLNRPHITIKYIDFLKEKTNIKCIYYGHDLHFLRLKREYELTGNTEKLKESEEWLEKELYIMRRADMSYYPSYIEEEAIHAIDPSIAVKAITAYVYEEFLTDIEMDFSKREGIVFVGGFGHPPNEDAVLWFVENVYPYIKEKKDIPFYIVGSNATDRIKALDSDNIIVKGFVSEEELREIYNSCKMVVVPLRYGAGVKGKVVEALYYGLPMVSTTVGAEGITGIENIVSITDDAKEFAEYVIAQYDDNMYLEKSVHAYQAFVEDKFSIDAVWKIVAEDFR